MARARQLNVMPLTPLKIKYLLLEKTGSLINAAQQMSNDEYSFSADQLSKVVRGARRTGSATGIIQARVAKFLCMPEQKLWGAPRKITQRCDASKN